MSAAFPTAPKPKTLLGYHRQLAPTAAVRVSPLCLGAMSFGDAWEGFLGSCDKKTSFEIMDYFKDNGGNFIDTSSNYQNEESEAWIGEWMESRGCREEMVIATKFVTGYRTYEGDKIIQSNFGGTGTKGLKHSLEASLKKLRTSFVDVLYIHWWDYTTGIPEVMHSLDDMVKAGKVLYLGISDTPAWIVSKANQYARDHGLRQFVVYQGKWSAANRDFERDIIPMCRDEGMGLAPWGALGSGHFKTEQQRDAADGRKMRKTEENEYKISEVLERIAARKNSIITGVALAYVMHKTPYVFPICGGRKVEHLKGNIDALKISLTQDDINEIEDAIPFDWGFPANFALFKTQRGEIGPGDLFLVNAMGRFDFVEKTRAIPLGNHNEEQGL